MLNQSIQSQLSEDREALLYSSTYILYTQELDTIGCSLCDVRGMGRAAGLFMNEFITANNHYHNNCTHIASVYKQLKRYIL